MSKQTLFLLRKKFLNKFLIDGKKTNSFVLLNKVFKYLKLKNKNKFKLFYFFFLAIEPLFYIEKILFGYRLNQCICFLPHQKKIRTILVILQHSILTIKTTKKTLLSTKLSEEIYTSLFKTSKTFCETKVQNETILKLKNKSNYRWA